LSWVFFISASTIKEAIEKSEKFTFFLHFTLDSGITD